MSRKSLKKQERAAKQILDFLTPRAEFKKDQSSGKRSPEKQEQTALKIVRSLTKRRVWTEEQPSRKGFYQEEKCKFTEAAERLDRDSRLETVYQFDGQVTVNVRKGASQSKGTRT